ncbi:hypothetical protein AK812_SmicGene42304 [Symbiodinium microadriaticum]|uniref:Uncharacterized protein n=1 Tax=Symbiodinium microadriaticum TaxID=2951 RepID=A0A1Q9C3X3_SYMMI|nr:hypothetical protein AK812_SmicGene42304 [Symbiodinium microadriaticum]
MKGKDGCTNCIKLYVNTQTMTLQCFVPWAARDAISLCLSDACQFGTLLAEHVCKHPSVAHWMVLAESKPWHGADKSRFGEKALPAVMAVGLASTTGSMWYSSTSWSDVLGILFPSSSWQISIVMGSLACLSSVCFLHCQATVVSCRGDLSTDNQGRLLASSAAIYANLTFMPVLAHACAFHPQLKLLLLINKFFFAVGTFQFRDSIRRAGGDLIKTSDNSRFFGTSPAGSSFSWRDRGKAMEAIWHFLGCTSIDKADRTDKDASDMQLSAFEFRHYRTSLEHNQQKLVERVVNQWVAMLVKGIVIRVNGFEEKTFLDKDLLNLELSDELYPLDALCRMTMRKESDDVVMNVPWILDLNFDFEEGEAVLSFSFEQERHRLQFALMLRILRTRNPRLNLAGTFEVVNEDDDDEDDPAVSNFNRIVGSTRFDVQGTGISVIISVGSLNIHQHLRCNNRHVYLELFSDYPRRDKFLYAKSSYNNLPGAVLLGENDMKNGRKEMDNADQADGRKGNKSDQHLCTINFDLKNVKLKIPKVPFTVHGRLMVKDDFFPSVVATFELPISKAHLQDLRESAEKQAKQPEAVEVPLLRSSKHSDGPQEIASLQVRFLGFVTEENTRKKQTTNSKGNNEASREDTSSEEEDDEEEGEEEEEEDDEEAESEERGSGYQESSNAGSQQSSATASSR